MKTIKILFGITLITGVIGGLSLLLYHLGTWSERGMEDTQVQLFLLYIKLLGDLLVLVSKILLEATTLYFFYMLVFCWKVDGVKFEFEKPNANKNDN